MFELIFQKNERDVEIPRLITFLNNHNEGMESLLDVGARGSLYSPVLRTLFSRSWGIDLLPDPSVEKNYNEYIVGDFLYADLPLFDFVVSVSTIEHVGVEYVPTRLYKTLQKIFFTKLTETARKGLFVSFPYGEAILFDGFYNVIDRTMLDDFKKDLKGWKSEIQFISANDPTDAYSWREIPQSLADKATNGLTGRVNTICLIEALR